MAHRIGSLIFCPNCGNLLDIPKDNDSSVTCELCGREETIGSYEYEITTRSHPDAFPSPLRQKRKTQTKIHEGEGLLRVTETCPKCGHREAYSKEVQMRSADEGSTIFYTVKTLSSQNFAGLITALTVCLMQERLAHR